MQRIALTHRGFTLIELMIAVVIVAIIATIAVPTYQAQTLKARRSDGQAFLLTLQSRMERYIYDNNVYPASLALLNGYSSASELSPEGYYEVSIKAASDTCPLTSCYVLVATPRGAQVSDGALELHSNGTKVGNWSR